MSLNLKAKKRRFKLDKKEDFKCVVGLLDADQNVFMFGLNMLKTIFMTKYRTKYNFLQTSKVYYSSHYVHINTNQYNI